MAVTPSINGYPVLEANVLKLAIPAAFGLNMN